MANPNNLEVRENIKSLFLSFGASETFATFLTEDEEHQLNIDTIKKLIIVDDQNIKDAI